MPRIARVVVPGQPHHVTHDPARRAIDARVLTMMRIGQNGAAPFRQTERFIQFTKRKQARVTRDVRAVEFELDFPSN